MLKIRLTRVGKKHQPSYRVVVTPKENPVQGQYLDLVGTYNPIRAEVNFNQEKVLQWLNKGAQPSERISRLLHQAGLTHKLIKVKTYEARSAKKAAAEQAMTKPKLNQEIAEATTQTTSDDGIETSGPIEETPEILAEMAATTTESTDDEDPE